MAAAGTLSRPNSAQGVYSFNSFQNYYPASSTKTSPKGVRWERTSSDLHAHLPGFSRSGSAGADYITESDTETRRLSSISKRFSIDDQSVPVDIAPLPTRIYGSRYSARSKSNDNLYATIRSAPVDLHRNHTFPAQGLESRSIMNHEQKNFPIRAGVEQVSQQLEDEHPTSTILVQPSNQIEERSPLTSPRPYMQDILSRPNYAQTITLPFSRSLKDEQSGDISTRNYDQHSSTAQFASDSLSGGSSLQPIISRTSHGTHAPGQLVTPSVLAGIPNVPGESSNSRSHDLITKNDQSNDNFRLTTATRSGPYDPAEDTSGELVSRLEQNSSRNRPNDEARTLKQRLRRALSFSSATALSAVPRQNAMSDDLANTGSKSKLYAGTNRSSDNLSISSTASSASLMLRKFSHGLTKHTSRSFSSIFSGSKSRKRPDADAVRVSSDIYPGTINYINAEADLNSSQQYQNGHLHGKGSRLVSDVVAKTSRLHITNAESNVDGHGSVSFPRLSQEIAGDDARNRRGSMHLERPLPIDTHTNSVLPVPKHVINRSTGVVVPSISDTERPAFRGKGILKKTFVPVTSTTTVSERSFFEPPLSVDSKDFDIHFEALPHLAFDLSGIDLGSRESESHDPTPLDTNNSPSPEDLSHRLPRESRALLNFSPRITIHETYNAQEYDRRGEIATCNRLTPLLAQRIKEELNAFKMDEMSVAEESKVYTHFFT